MASVKMSQQLLSAPASTRSAQNTRRMSEEVQCPCPASASLPADRAIALQCLGPYCRHLIFSSSSNLCLFLAIRGIQSLRARRVCGQAVHTQPVRCRKGTAASGIDFICSLGLFQLVEWKELIRVPCLSDKCLKLLSAIHIGSLFSSFFPGTRALSECPNVLGHKSSTPCMRNASSSSSY